VEPENFQFGGGLTQSIIHPVVLVGMLIAIVMIFSFRRRSIVVPFLLITFLVPTGQQIYLAGMHWLALRIVILAGCVRLLWEIRIRGKLFPGGLNGIDKTFILWACYASVAPILRFRAVGPVPLQMAFLLQAIGGYFFLRYLIQNVDDIAAAAKALALLTLTIGLCMANERSTGVNVFGYLGGIPVVSLVRGGLVRARGCFGHAILAGTFGATLVPLFYWLLRSGKAKALAVLGIVGSLLMVFTSASSTPVMACAGGIGALFLWPIRRSMGRVRWGIVLTLLALMIVMKAPVWFLIARINVTGSSDAYGRAMLVDNLVRHFSDWWLVGTTNNSNWGDSMFDLANQFVKEGVSGGLVAILSFIVLISRSFGRLGTMRKQVEGDKRQEWLYWSLGAVLFAHLFAFFGVSYFDQNQMWWYALLAMISARTSGLRSVRPSERGEKPALEVAPI
jgi:hypothetical protein